MKRWNDETMKRWNDETMKRVGPEIDNETNLFMILVRLRRTYAFTLHKAMLSWRHEHSSKTASTTSQGYPPSRLDATFRIRTDHIYKFLRHPFHLSTLKRSFLKTMPFQNAPILKLFRKSPFLSTFSGVLEWMTGKNTWKGLCFQTKTQKFGRGLKERCKR